MSFFAPDIEGMALWLGRWLVVFWCSCIRDADWPGKTSRSDLVSVAMSIYHPLGEIIDYLLSFFLSFCYSNSHRLLVRMKKICSTPSAVTKFIIPSGYQVLLRTVWVRWVQFVLDTRWTKQRTSWLYCLDKLNSSQRQLRKKMCVVQVTPGIASRLYDTSIRAWQSLLTWRDRSVTRPVTHSWILVLLF